MRHFLASLLLLAAPAMAADMVARNGNDRIRLSQEPCPVSVIKVIPEGQRGYFSRAYAQINGKDYAACWAVRSDGMVYLMYEDGDQGLLGMGEFKEDAGV